MDTNSIYDSYWESGIHKDPHWSNERIKSEFKPLLNSQNIIDYGCGMINRKYGDTLAAMVPSYIGADVSQFIVNENIKTGFQSTKIDPETSKLPYENEAFDGAVCCEVFEHLFDPLLAAKEIHRLLKPGGKLVAMVPNFGYHPWRLMALLRAQVPLEPETMNNRYRGVHIRYFSKLMFKRLLLDAGFSHVHVTAYDYSSIWDVTRAFGPFARISDLARKYLPQPFHLNFLQWVWPNVFAMRLKAVAVK